MARFDVCRYGSKSAPLIVDVQANVLDDLASRVVVVPLVPATAAKREALQRLKPPLEIAGKPRLFMATDIGVVPRAQLGAFVATIEEPYRDRIAAAPGFLLQGF